jgi:Delta7-sterol 5-desaturase
MIREVRYLLMLILTLCLGVAGYDLLRGGRQTASPAGKGVGEVEFQDAAGVTHRLPQHWSGSSLLSPLLGVDLQSELSFARTDTGSATVSFVVGGERSEADAVRNFVVARTNGATQATWSGRKNDYQFVQRDSETTARLYVSRHRARYLVLMTAAGAATAPTTPATHFVHSLSTIAQEGWYLLSQRLIGLLVTYGFIAGLFHGVFWFLLKKKLARRKIQTEMPKKGAVLAEIGYSFLAVVATAILSYGTIMAVETGHTKMYREVAQYGWGYWFFSLAMLFVLIDAYSYWTHRLMHHRLLFKYFHKVHHHSNRPTPWATFSVNVNEIFVNAMFMPLVILVMPVHVNTSLVFALVGMVKNVLNHLGYEIFPAGSNKGILKWLVSPTYHEMHHLKFNYNYGAFFTWWDKWMGTEHAKYDETFEKVHAAPSPQQVILEQPQP